MYANFSKMSPNKDTHETMQSRPQKDAPLAIFLETLWLWITTEVDNAECKLI